MRSRLFAALVLAALLVMPGRALAAPTADVVVVWAPDVELAPIAGAAQAEGAALIDRTPPRPAAPPAIAATIRRGIDAYEALRFDDAWAALSAAGADADASGGGELSTAALSDLFLYRGLTQLQRGEPTAAWDELTAAAVVAPSRVLDPARFSPRVIEDVARARDAALARPRVALTVTAPADCAVALDGGAVTTATTEVVAGPHWIHARCTGGVRWGTRVEASGAALTVAVAPAMPTAPTDDELLIQARAAGARAALAVVTHGEVATVRLLAIDGRERARRVVAPAAIAATVRVMLRAAPTTRWYRSRWAWMAGAAAVTAAIAIPITAALVGRGDPATVTIRGPGALP